MIIGIQEHLRQLLQTVSPSKMLQITLCLDALFGHFYKPIPRCQSKSYNSITIAMGGVLKNNGDRT